MAPLLAQLREDALRLPLGDVLCLGDLAGADPGRGFDHGADALEALLRAGEAGVGLGRAGGGLLAALGTAGVGALAGAAVGPGVDGAAVPGATPSMVLSAFGA